MLKTVLCFIALAVLVDALAFDGFYRDVTIGESVQLGHKLMSLDWQLSH